MSSAYDFFIYVSGSISTFFSIIFKRRKINSSSFICLFSEKDIADRYVFFFVYSFTLPIFLPLTFLFDCYTARRTVRKIKGYFVPLAFTVGIDLFPQNNGYICRQIRNAHNTSPLLECLHYTTLKSAMSTIVAGFNVFSIQRCSV